MESRYDQETANKLIYHSWLMGLTLLLLSLNLTMVLIDRWPWKKKHKGFVLAHIGILTMICGSIVSRYSGKEGSVRLQEGKTASVFQTSDMEIKVYSSYNGEDFSLLYEEDVDFLFKKISVERPYLISTAGVKFAIDTYLPFALGRESFKPNPKGDGPAVRFHLDGSRADMVEWIWLSKSLGSVTKKIGPARLILTTDKKLQAEKNTDLILLVEGKKLFFLRSGQPKKALRKGDRLLTGWMDFQFRALEFFPKAQREFIFTKRDRPSPSTLKAVHVTHDGHSAWLGQNGYARFFKKDRVYALAYLNKTYELGFDLKLTDFRIKKYQGSEKAKSYESEVSFNGQKTIISMNKPLKHKGWTLYQSSFESSKEGGRA